VCEANTEMYVWDEARFEHARSVARDMFYHGYNNYMQYAFPRMAVSGIICAFLKKIS
jgi:hypothetical protein